MPTSPRTARLGRARVNVTRRGVATEVAVRPEVPCYVTTTIAIPPSVQPPCDKVAKWLVYSVDDHPLPMLACDTCMERWLGWGSVSRVDPL